MIWFNKNFLKTKIKFYGDQVTDFFDKEISKEGTTHTCLAVISLDSSLKKDENYYPQKFLECNKKVIRHIDYESSVFSYYEESDDE